MITLSQYDIVLADRIQSGLQKCVGPKKAAKSRIILKRLKAQGYKVNSTKIREIIHYLRTQRKMFICGDSSGYYVPSDDQDAQKQIRSMLSRIREIKEATDALVDIRMNNFKQAELFS